MSAPTGLAEDGVRHADLADVVEVAGHMDTVGQLGWDAQALGQGLGDHGHFLGMGQGMAVLGVDGPAQGFGQLVD